MKQLLTFLLLLLSITSKAQEFPITGSYSAVSKLKQAWVDGSTGVRVAVMKNDFFGTKGGEYVICYGCTYTDDSVNWVRNIWATASFGVDVAWQRVGDYSYTPTGTSSQTLNGQGGSINVSNLFVSWALSLVGRDLQMTATPASGSPQQSNTVSFKIPATYSGTTNSSGIYAVTFPVAYSVAPNIQANVVGGNNKWTAIPTVTTTGFSIYVQLRTDVLGLLPSYSNVNGATVDVLITEK